MHGMLHVQQAGGDAYNMEPPFDDTCDSSQDPTAELLGWVGTVLAVFVFAAPLETMLKVCKACTLGDFDSVPFMAMLVMASFWCVYALPFVTPCRVQVLVCNAIGVTLSLAYIAIFLRLADSTRRRKIGAGCAISAALAVGVSVTALVVDASLPHAASQILGGACIAGAIAAFGAPLLIVGKVIQTRSVEYMPLGLTLAITANCFVWAIYGLLTADTFVLICNGSGLLLGIVQLGVYVSVACFCTPNEGEAAPLYQKAP